MRAIPPTSVEMRTATQVLKRALIAMKNADLIGTLEQQAQKIEEQAQHIVACEKDILRLHDAIRLMHKQNTNIDFAWECASAEFPADAKARFLRYRELSLMGTPQGYAELFVKDSESVLTIRS